MTQITTNPSLVEMEQLDEKIIELEQCLTWANNEDQYNEILRALSAYHHQMDIKAEDLEHCLGLKPGTGKAISTLIRNIQEMKANKAYHWDLAKMNGISKNDFNFIWQEVA